MTAANVANPLEEFQWAPQPRAEVLVTGLVEEFLTRNDFARKFGRKLREQAGVRFQDMVDSIHLPKSDELVRRLEDAEFVRSPVAGAPERYVQENGIFPAVVLSVDTKSKVFLKVESIADFMSTWQITFQHEIDGAPLAALRRGLVGVDRDADLLAIERHGFQGFQVPTIDPSDAILVLKHQEAFRRRVRRFGHANDGFRLAKELIGAAIKDLNVDRACDLFFASEREFWQRRNRAAQVQKARQDKLGIGWANHDHHTYRSSREHFATMIGIFELLGFHCRERFYAGAQAGWGAQVLEQPNAGIIIFADVDLSPDELFQDFAHEGLAPRDALGTVGLWCALHGEAFLEAGMHHLECQFDFDALKEQLEASEGVMVMKPFTDFPYLRQAFTEGEIWPVRPERIDRLLKERRITDEQAARFREKGAIGSHLENLQRNQGFKGFNQTGVSEIIARTDPRTQGG